MEFLGLDIRAVIASFLSRSDLNSFITAYPINEEHFWSLMIKERFPKYYIPSATGFNWTSIYLNLLDSGDLILENPYIPFKRSFELFRYMSKYKLIILKDSVILDLVHYRYYSDLINVILNYYTVSIPTLSKILRISIEYRDHVGVKLISEYAKTKGIYAELISDMNTI